jgi:protein-tyrosine phosphatase
MLEGVINFRDVGGHRTRHGRLVRTGRLYRSAHLANATDADLEQLEQLGIRVVIDFRGPRDIEDDGEDRLPNGAELVSIPMFDPARGADIRDILYSSPPAELAAHFGEGRALEAMLRGSRSFVSSTERAEQFGHMLRTIVAAGAPALIHCSAGKDRTGWAASLVLLALDVPDDALIAHYLESNQYRRKQGGRVDQLVAAGIDPAILEPFFGVREEYLRASLAALDEHWGGLDGYLARGLGADTALLDDLRAWMLEP